MRHPIPAHHRVSLLASCLVAFLTPAAATADLSGVAYFDYFYNAQGATITADSSAFAFRRIYLTYDSEISDQFSARFRLEADGAELTSKGKLGVFVKDASLKWKSFVPHGALVAGLSGTPLWTQSEKVWGYRSIEKTILDFRGLGTSADVGIALQGNLGADGPVGYHLMFANGAGQKPEDTRSKKVYLGVPIKLAKQFIVEAVGDYEGGPGDRDRYTLKAFVGFDDKKRAVGVEAIRRVNMNAGTAGADVIPVGISAFGRIAATNRVALFARFDYYDPDSESDAGLYEETLFLGGVDYSPAGDVHFIPNVGVVSFSGKDSAMSDRDANVVVRLTLVYSYK